MQNVSIIGEGHHSVVWQSDKGMVYNSFDNQILAPQLKAMGLSRDTAFACLFDLLYRPTDAAVSAVRPQLVQLLDPKAFKV